MADEPVGEAVDAAEHLEDAGDVQETLEDAAPSTEDAALAAEGQGSSAAEDGAVSHDVGASGPYDDAPMSEAAQGSQPDGGDMGRPAGSDTQSPAPVAADGTLGPVLTVLRVQGVNGATEAEVKRIFEAYGRVERVELPTPDLAIVRFQKPRQAQKAFEKENGNPVRRNGPAMRIEFERPDRSRHLWVGNLALSATEGELRQLFMEFGPLADIKLTRAGERASAFVDFGAAEHAERALRELNGRDVQGRSIRIEFSTSGAARSQMAEDDPGGQEHTRHLIVSNLARGVQEWELEREFRVFGEVMHTEIVRGAAGEGGEPGEASHALVSYRTIAQAVNARTKLQNVKIQGSPLHIKFGKGKPCRHLWIGNVNASITEAFLREEFGRFGKVENISIKHATSCALLSLERTEEGEAAFEALNGKPLGGSIIKIDYCERNERRPPVMRGARPPLRGRVGPAGRPAAPAGPAPAPAPAPAPRWLAEEEEEEELRRVVYDMLLDRGHGRFAALRLPEALSELARRTIRDGSSALRSLDRPRYGGLARFCSRFPHMFRVHPEAPGGELIIELEAERPPPRDPYPPRGEPPGAYSAYFGGYPPAPPREYGGGFRDGPPPPRDAPPPPRAGYGRGPPRPRTPAAPRGPLPDVARAPPAAGYGRGPPPPDPRDMRGDPGGPTRGDDRDPGYDARGRGPPMPDPRRSPPRRERAPPPPDLRDRDRDPKRRREDEPMAGSGGPAGYRSEPARGYRDERAGGAPTSLLKGGRPVAPVEIVPLPGEGALPAGSVPPTVDVTNRVPFDAIQPYLKAGIRARVVLSPGAGEQAADALALFADYFVSKERVGLATVGQTTLYLVPSGLPVSSQAFGPAAQQPGNVFALLVLN
eukprot:tig00021532_g22191.t1